MNVTILDVTEACENGSVTNDKEEFIAPLIDDVYSKVLDGLKDYTLEKCGNTYYATTRGGLRYQLSLGVALILAPEPVKIVL